MTDKRFEKLQELIQTAGLDGIVLNPGPSLGYLTGLNFHLMERPTVVIYVPPAEPVIVLPELEAGKLASSRVPLRPVTYGDDPSSWQSAFELALSPLNLEQKRIGLEPTRLRYLELSYLTKAAPGAIFLSGENVLNHLRIRKDQSEIHHMRKAAQIAQEALLAVLPMVKAGVSENAIAAELTIALLRAGSDAELPFAPIVAGGPNSANPHASPTDRLLHAGDMLVIDWGARWQGYCSDLTRSFAIGPVSSELEKIYMAVQQGNRAGREAGKPGLAAGAVDQAARQVIEQAGYGSLFTHRTGHGLGLEDHETPYIFNANPVLLDVGMTYTVEPGIYLPGIGGVRIEDDLLVTESGSESLSNLPRELSIL